MWSGIYFVQNHIKPKDIPVSAETILNRAWIILFNVKTLSNGYNGSFAYLIFKDYITMSHEWRRTYSYLQNGWLTRERCCAAADDGAIIYLYELWCVIYNYNYYCYYYIHTYYLLKKVRCMINVTSFRSNNYSTHTALSVRNSGIRSADTVYNILYIIIIGMYLSSIIFDFRQFSRSAQFSEQII